MKDVKYPANSQIFNSYIVKLTTFDILNTESIEDEIYNELPDLQPYNINFEASGIETKLFIKNIGIVIWFAVAIISMSIFLLLSYKIKIIWRLLG